MLISANGITLYAEMAGRGDLTFVFLPYFGGTARSWSHVVEALPDWVRSLALDIRGWGRSDRPDDGYDIVTLADDVQAAISALGLERYVLVGHSMGGKIAQLLASRRPVGLVGLVLVAPSPAQGKTLSNAERTSMAGAYNSIEAVSWTLDNILAGPALKQEWREQIIADSLGGAAAAKGFWPASAIAEDVSANLADIDVPVLVLGGELDKVDSIEMLRTIVVPALPSAGLDVMAGVGHLIPLEAPVELARRLLDFILGLENSRPVQTLNPEDVAGRFDHAFNIGDLDSLMKLFCQDAIMRMTDGMLVKGTAALRKALSSLLAARPKLRNIIRRVIVNHESALLLLDWELNITPPNEQGILQQGTATQVLQREADGNWRLRICNPLGIA